jgi:aldehyde dehydrogenase (NAD+)
MNMISNPAAMTSRTPYSFEQLYFAGRWAGGHAGKGLDVRSPFSGQLLTTIPKADLSDIDAAFRGAEEAQRSWAKALPVQRAETMRRAARVMEDRHDEIISWLVQEAGSTIAKSEIEWGAVHATLLEAATLPSRLEGRIVAGDYPGKENRIYRVPVGVVAVISPWNWPLHLSMRSVAPALALGNAVVLKPASDTPVTGGLLIAKLFEEAGLPPGVLSVVAGDSDTIGDGFVQHPISRVVSFTGSTRVGRHIGQLAVAGPTLKKAMLELGGNDPLIVLEDADLDLAVHIAIVAKFLHQGQMCIAANRIIVLDPIYDAFVERFVEYAKTLKVGDPNDPSTVIGPIINHAQMAGLSQMLNSADKEGARKRLGDPAHGLLLPPHVYDRVTPEMSLGRHEIFGPIAPLIRAKDESHAVFIANDTENGLTSAVVTKDLDRGAQFAHQIKAGMTHVNDVTAIDMPALPFGGEKNSGLGRFGSPGMIEAFTTEHWISIQRTPSVYPF